MNYVYLIQSNLDKSVYVGSTRDLRRRLKQHNCGKTKSTKSKIPYSLIYYEAYTSYSLARKREIKIKQSWEVKEEILERLNVRPHRPEA